MTFVGNLGKVSASGSLMERNGFEAQKTLSLLVQNLKGKFRERFFGDIARTDYDTLKGTLTISI